MANSFTIAHAYSKAIFDLALEQNSINHWKQVLQVFSKITQHKLIQSLYFQLLDPKKVSEVFINIFEDYAKDIALNVFNKNLIYIISKNNRILLLPIILNQFNNLYNFHIKTTQIKIVSHNKLNNNQIKKISKIMENYLSQKIQLIFNIDKNIIGGIVLYIKDNVIDLSLKGRLSRLHHTLLQD